MVMSQLDAGQIIKSAYDDASESIKIKNAAGALITEAYDSIDITYVAAGNGAGEIETVIYKSAGTTVATLTLAYDASSKLTSVTKS